MKSMRIAVVLFALSWALLMGLCPSVRSDVIYFDGDTYAAIAYSPTTGNFGYAYNYGSRWAAERAALRNCKAKDAKIVTWVSNGFCALALGDDKSAWGVGWSYGQGATNTYAKKQALMQCGKRTKNARLVVCVCSVNVKPELP
jgi:serine/threonine-protein kinase